ncbi:hypothetical protein QU593_10090 [Rossellomorea marisflavi]|uniref:hypothetical protein n=1 Tax=Rossellomorea marisflavi TaxID=189381 RepID=UPI0025B25DF0|nr:hypothetical protein [Rossellomorea marisflavi]WJV20754.1 hypothetical protein QU593_10090 [Rossellomorea marisflavi]
MMFEVLVKRVTDLDFKGTEGAFHYSVILQKYENDKLVDYLGLINTEADGIDKDAFLSEYDLRNPKVIFEAYANYSIPGNLIYDLVKYGSYTIAGETVYITLDDLFYLYKHIIVKDHSILDNYIRRYVKELMDDKENLEVKITDLVSQLVNFTLNLDSNDEEQFEEIIKIIKGLREVRS